MRAKAVLFKMFCVSRMAASLRSPSRFTSPCFGRRLNIRKPSLGSKSDDFLDNLGDLLDQEIAKEKEAQAIGNNTASPPDTSSGDKNRWRTIYWKKQFWNREPAPPKEDPPSPVETILVRNRLVYVKRDDQLKLSGGAPISGNKARKMVALNDMDAKDFPSCVVSFGGPQSNAMLALAAIVHFKNQEYNKREDDEKKKRFVYYTKKLPRFLRNQPNGNLYRAQTLGMELVELSAGEYRNLFGGEWGGPTEPPVLDPPGIDSLWVPQGGACGMALRGAWNLANEIFDFWSREGRGRPLTVCIPGGTCSTAALVSAALQEIQKGEKKSNNSQSPDIVTVVIPCVGDEQYATRQMVSLLESTWGEFASSDTADRRTQMPTVLPPAPERPHYFGESNAVDRASYFQFGEPNEDILATFREMEEEYGLALDLLYGAPSWTILLRHFRTEKSTDSAAFDPMAPLAGREIMYVHSGGLEGVNSQLMRYKYKGFVEDVQLPGR